MIISQFYTSTKLVCLASLTVTTACTSSISFCFSSSSKCIYHLANRVFPARFWINMKRICSKKYIYSKTSDETTLNPLYSDDAWRHHPVNSGWCLKASFGHHQIDTMVMMIQLQVFTPYGVFSWSKNIFILSVNFYPLMMALILQFLYFYVYIK